MTPRTDPRKAKTYAGRKPMGSFRMLETYRRRREYKRRISPCGIFHTTKVSSPKQERYFLCIFFVFSLFLMFTIFFFLDFHTTFLGCTANLQGENLRLRLRLRLRFQFAKPASATSCVWSLTAQNRNPIQHGFRPLKG